MADRISKLWVVGLARGGEVVDGETGDDVGVCIGQEEEGKGEIGVFRAGV